MTTRPDGVQPDSVYRSPSKALYLDAMTKALGNLGNVSAGLKDEKDRVHYHPLVLDARTKVSGALDYIKGLLTSKGELRPDKVEVIRTATNRLLVLNANVISYAIMPAPFNERIVDSIPHGQRARVVNPEQDAALRMIIPAGKTFGEIVAKGREALEIAGRKRKYALIEDLLNRGQKEPGLTVACFIEFEDPENTDLHSSDIWKSLIEQRNAIPEGPEHEASLTKLLAKMDEIQRQFKRNLIVLVQIAGNNRAKVTNDYLGVRELDFLTGFLVRFGEAKGLYMDPQAGLIAMAKALNDAYGVEVLEGLSKEYQAFCAVAKGGAKLAIVPTQIVIGVEHPDHLMACLRAKNNESHGFPPLAFEPEVEQRSLGKQLVSEAFAGGLVHGMVEGTGDIMEKLLATDPVLVERVFCGDEPYSRLKEVADAVNGTPVDLVTLDMHCIDLMTSIFLPTTDSGKKLVRLVFMEPRNSRFTSTHANRRVGAMCSMVAFMLGADPKRRVGEQVWEPEQVKAGVLYAPVDVEEQIKNAEADKEVREALWRRRLLHYAAATRLIEPELGSDEARVGFRLSPDKTLRLICQDLEPFRTQATTLANNLLSARRKGGNGWDLELFTTEDLKKAGFKDVESWKEACAKAKQEASARRWFYAGFKERAASSETTEPEMEIPATPEGSLEQAREGLVEAVRKVRTKLQDLPEAIRLVNHLVTIQEKVNVLRVAAKLVADEAGAMVCPMDNDNVNALCRELTETYRDANPKVQAAISDNEAILDKIGEALSEAPNTVRPSVSIIRGVTAQAQPGGAQ